MYLNVMTRSVVRMDAVDYAEYVRVKMQSVLMENVCVSRIVMVKNAVMMDVEVVVVSVKQWMRHV